MPHLRLFASRHGRLLTFLALCFHGLACAGHPSASARSIKPLPVQQLESAYKNGDLDSVVFFIKMGRTLPVFLNRGDSLTAFKYLGIIYSADASTREKGRYYFNQLFRLDAKASITDMLPGENARMTFKEAREEYFELHPNLAQPADPMPAPAMPEPAAQEAIAGPAPFAVPAEKRSYKWAWVTGGVVAAGAATAIILIDPPKKTYKLHD